MLSQLRYQAIQQLITILGCLLLLSACDHAAPPDAPISHDAYVWQRRWTPALKDALVVAGPWVGAWHVLAAEVGRHGRLSPVAIDPAALAQTGRPVFLVIRINGQLSDWEPAAIAQASLALVAKWRASGVPVTGLEIDHDCATSRLPDYATFIGLLRPATAGQGLPLVITALPTWLASPALPHLLRQVDEAVLQLHAVTNPRQGLFDPEQAEAWVKKFSAISPVKFRVALPTYGSRIAWDANGRVVAVESEVPKGLAGSRTQELTVSPMAVAAVLASWRKRAPPGFAGVVWFRLPTSDDQRAWSLATWQAVMEGRTLTPTFAAMAVPGEYPGVFDVFVTNESELDGPAPTAVRVLSPQCSAADALGAYHLVSLQPEVQFHRAKPAMLRAHARSMVGWVRCPDSEVRVDAYP
ncbi:MAG: DUF3142 domain-containing protein [Methylococcaceae bacterium]|nr:MAG: DUF3142 domain-containing protein [Methylococcaceae bacterium]